MQIIVTGVDGSETAERAARKAAFLAEGLGADLHVISAYGKFAVDTFASGDEEFRFTTIGDAEQVAAKVAAQLKRGFPGLAVRSSASEGKPADALVKTAERLGADLIVVGNRRVQGPSRILGSIARDVAGHAHCDVYVVHTVAR